ncbi:MAG: diguanylate cyclase [Sulfuricurvum sp.]|nr:diguanylate cyclase [Sulfuricurvum sp.]
MNWSPKNLINTFLLYIRIQHSPYYLISLIFFSTFTVAVTSIVLLSFIGYNQQKDRLVELVQTQSKMIEIVVKNSHEPEGGKLTPIQSEKIIRQIAQAHNKYHGFGESGEFALGTHDGDQIRFLLKKRHATMKEITPVPWHSNLAEPMRRALNGQRGIDILLDYRGAKVLAAYEPIDSLGWGLVAKIDMAEVERPYYIAAAYALLVAMIISVIGSFVYWYFIRLLIKNLQDTNDLNDLLIEQSTTGLALCLTDGTILRVNKTFTTMLRLSEEKLKGKSFFETMYWEDYETSKQIILNMDEDHILEPFESSCIDMMGNKITVKISAKMIGIHSNRYIWISIENIEEYKRRETRLKIASIAFEHSAEAIFITDKNGIIIKGNKAFEQVTGYSLEYAIGKSPRILKSGRHDTAFYHEMFKVMHTTGVWKGEIWNKRENGEIYPSLQSISVIYDEKGKVSKYVSLLTDISAQKALEQQLSNQARKDALTGLPNRLSFTDKLESVILKARSSKSTFALFFIDLNKFKEINDTFGHEAGDTILKVVSNTLTKYLRSNDFVARLGGDEFVVIVESVRNADEAIVVAKNLIVKTNEPVIVDGHELSPSISIGIAFYPQDGSEVSALLKNADQAMYHAKHLTEDHCYLSGTE